MLLTLSFACLLLAGGCAVNPVTGKNELSLISADQEVAIGAQQYQPAQQSQGGRYYIDPELQTYVTAVGRRLAAVSDRAGLPYEFVVLNNAVPNAWALPGGKIAINTGLLLHLEDESQLAAVLAHEIVHAAARHGATQMSRGLLLDMGTQVAGIAAHNAGYAALGSAAQLGAQAWMARYGRDDELESDAYGMEYMSRAGYDPLGAVELQETFVRLSAERQEDFLSGLFASHPPSRERVNRNQTKAASLPSGGLRNRDLYQQRIAQLKKDQPAYEAQAEAIKALNDKNPQLAIEALDRAIKIQPRDGYFRELRGHAWQMLDDHDKAERDFSAAISRNPS
ncbi:MAG: M48 family metalloprotease, partial [Bacteroidales bacterium]|nr:M48 family metalloprotease [Bacteroidales bacterium]